MINKYLPLIRQFFKFGVVGVINTAVDLLVLTALIFVFPGGARGLLYTLFKAISFIVASINSYLFNKLWTFKGESDQQKKTAVEFSEFFVVSVVGMIINVLTATLVVNLVTPVYNLEAFWPQIGALAGTAVGLLWNFVGYKVFVFTRR